MDTAKILKKFKGGSMAETFLIEKDNELFVRKIAENGPLSSQKLKAQWEWLREFNENISDIFPQTNSFIVDTDKSYYDMEFLDMESVRDVFLKENNLQAMTSLLLEIVKFGGLIAQPVYDHNADRETYITQKHIRKMFDRCKDIQDTDFYQSEYLIINGKKMKNLQLLLNEIEADAKLMEVLKPKQWYRSHGDLTFQNIMTNGTSIKIIDPRGEGPDSVYYDISKLYQSCDGKYDLLIDGNYTVTKSLNDIISIDYEIIDGVDKFNDIFEIVRELIPQYYQNLDEHWDIISRFYEGSHFISMTPFRLKENLDITLICYGIGITILNEVLEAWKNVES